MEPGISVVQDCIKMKLIFSNKLFHPKDNHVNESLNTDNVPFKGEQGVTVRRQLTRLP